MTQRRKKHAVLFFVFIYNQQFCSGHTHTYSHSHTIHIFTRIQFVLILSLFPWLIRSFLICTMVYLLLLSEKRVQSWACECFIKRFDVNFYFTDGVWLWYWREKIAHTEAGIETNIYITRYLISIWKFFTVIVVVFAQFFSIRKLIL